MSDETDPAYWSSYKSTPEEADWLAERDRECRERHGVALFVKRTGPPPTIDEFMVGSTHDDALRSIGDLDDEEWRRGPPWVDRADLGP